MRWGGGIDLQCVGHEGSLYSDTVEPAKNTCFFCSMSWVSYRLSLSVWGSDADTWIAVLRAFFAQIHEVFASLH